MAKTVFTGIAELLTLQGVAKKRGRHVSEPDLSIIPSAAMVAEDGRIAWIGKESDLPDIKGAEEIFLANGVVLPAFLECHTHLAFAGDRAKEFEWRMQGVSYQEIAARGGGIVSTVSATRACPEVELLKIMQQRANRFVEQGVTTLEVKSGYGLDLASEVKSLKAASRLQGPRIVRTFLGPHSKPKEHASVESYFSYVMEELLPKIAAEKLAERADIFVEKGFFTAEQARKYFAKAKSLGLSIVAHVEQLSHSEGTKTALEAGAVSVDHVIQLKEDEITQVAKSDTTAVLLPASDFYLKMSYPPARKLIDQGACVALSTDFNPGTSPTQDLSFVGVLARIEMNMSLPEVISAWTFGAAKALEKAANLGSLEIGKLCDFSILDNGWQSLFYSVGHHPVRSVWKDGTKLFENKF